MLTIVPYVVGMLQEKTASTPGAEFVELPEDDPYAYWRLLKTLYRHGDDWCIIEQDIVINRQQLRDLERCKQSWCVYGYLRGGAEMVALGVFRLRRDIMATWPNLLTFDTPQQVYFDQCDGTLYGKLKDVGLEPHRHYPDVGHEQSAYRTLIDFKVSRNPITPYGSSATPERGEVWT